MPLRTCISDATPPSGPMVSPRSSGAGVPPLQWSGRGGHRTDDDTTPQHRKWGKALNAERGLLHDKGQSTGVGVSRAARRSTWRGTGGGGRG